MNPIPGVIEKNVAQMAWAYIQQRFSRHRELQLQQEKEFLQGELKEARSGDLAFQKLMSELLCRRDDDNMYWKKDGSGGPYCFLCLHGDRKLMPLTNGDREGAFYCRLHDHSFVTKERREKDRRPMPQPQSGGYGGNTGRSTGRDFGRDFWMER